MNKYLLFFLFSLAFFNPLLEIKGAPLERQVKSKFSVPNIQNEDVIYNQGWVKIRNDLNDLSSEENKKVLQEMKLVRLYILENAVYHSEYPIQIVYASTTLEPNSDNEDCSEMYKIVYGRNDISKEEIKNGKVKFQGEGANLYIKPYISLIENHIHEGEVLNGVARGTLYDYKAVIDKSKQALEDGTIIVYN